MEQTHVIPEQRTSQETIDFLPPIADRSDEFPEEVTLRALTGDYFTILRAQLREGATHPQVAIEYLSQLPEVIREALNANGGIRHRDDIQKILFNPFVEHLLDQTQHAGEGRHRDNRVAIARAATNIVYAELLQGTHDPSDEYWQTA